MYGNLPSKLPAVDETTSRILKKNLKEVLQRGNEDEIDELIASTNRARREIHTPEQQAYRKKVIEQFIRFYRFDCGGYRKLWEYLGFRGEEQCTPPS